MRRSVGIVGLSVFEYFQRYGEAEFRKKEAEVLRQLVWDWEARAYDQNLIVALGAGYQGDVPSAAKVLWLRRESDAAGRVFLGEKRPALEPGLAPLEEYELRFSEREKRFAQWAHQIVTLPEGWPGETERSCHSLRTPLRGGLTLAACQWDHWQELLSWQPAFLELRNDLLSNAQILEVFQRAPGIPLLLSFRKKEGMEELFSLCERSDWDWALELGDLPSALSSRSVRRARGTLSLHNRG